MSGEDARAAEAERALSELRHDLRGILAPAMLSVERIMGHADPEVVRVAKVVAASIERAAARLERTRRR